MAKAKSKPLNQGLGAAKVAKQDEFYTQYVDIQKEGGRSKFRVRVDLNFQHTIEAAFKINTQLRQCLAPVLDRHCPFLCRI